MSGSQPVRFAIVGAGRIARDYTTAFAATAADAELVAVADTNRDAAHDLAGAAGLGAERVRGTAAELLAAGGVDAVLLSTPPATHAPIATDLMRGGVSVLCEKPLCLNTREAEHLAAEARTNGVVFSMATKFRFVEDVAIAKQLVDAGRIGEVLLFENAFTGHVDMSNRWNSDPALSGGGVLMDNGTHSVDLVRHFLGPITAVHALAGPRVQPIPVEDNVLLYCRTASDAMCSIDLSWSFDKSLPTYVSIYGTRGAIRLGWRGSEIRDDAAGGAWEPFGSGYGKVDAFANQIRDFAGAVRGTHAPRVSTADAVASVRVIEAAYASMHGVEAGGWVSTLADGDADTDAGSDSEAKAVAGSASGVV